MTCDQAKSFMHTYLDGDADEETIHALQTHVDHCEACSKHMDELLKTESMIRLEAVTPTPSEDLAARILKKMPRRSKTRQMLDWARNHPTIVAAAVFIIIMAAGIIPFEQSADTLAVQSSEMDKLEINGNVVVVPAGVTIKGDLVVENGILDVKGHVEGDVTVISGQVQLASTAMISGKLTKINQWIDRMWYAIFEWVKT